MVYANLFLNKKSISVLLFKETKKNLNFHAIGSLAESNLMLENGVFRRLLIY
jgi:hypothetical protein